MVNIERVPYFIFGSADSHVRLLSHALQALAFLLMLAALRPGKPRGEGFPHPLEIAAMAMSGLVLFYHRFYDVCMLIFVAYGLFEFGRQRGNRRLFSWRLAVGLLLFLSFGSSGTGVSATFNKYVFAATSIPIPHFSCIFVLALYLLCLWLLYRMDAPASAASASALPEAVSNGHS